MYKRKKTRVIKIGKISVGGNNKIAIQSMCNTSTKDIKSTIRQVHELENAGCNIIRIAVPDKETVFALKAIKKEANAPVVADIHFDYRLAIAAAAVADKIRINPGNIGGEKSFREVVRAAKDNSIPIRIGVNTGSLEKDILERYERTPKAAVESAARAIKLTEKLDFHDVVVSLKSSDVMDTIEAYRMFSERFNCPLHVGVTEAGPLPIGAVKSAVGIGTLLAEGIGDTIRVSLTENPVEEVYIAKEILLGLGLAKGRVFVSCPTCGRTDPKIIEIAKEIEAKTRNIKKPIKIAVMGCEVNGPGEAMDADIGVAFSKDRAFLFRKGKIIKNIGNEDIIKTIYDKISSLTD